MKTGRLRLFPLNTVLFPGAVLALHVFEPRYKQMISECLDSGEAFGVCLIREGGEAGDPAVHPHDVGTTAEIGDVTPLPSGRYYITTVGRRRFRIDEVVSREPYLLATVTYFDEDEPDDQGAVDGLIEEVRGVFSDYMSMLVEFSGTHAQVELPADALRASFVVGDALQVADAMKQRLLELIDTEERLNVELGFLRRLLPQLRALLERKRSSPVRERDDAPGGVNRATQEKLFGKYFSQN